MSPGADLHAAAGRFLSALERADRAAALILVEELAAAGADPVAVLEDVVCAAQLEVGRRWQRGDWSVAQEHAATAISDAAVGAVALRADGRSTSAAAAPGHVVVACVEEEWHALPARIVAEALRLHGWRTTFLGASTPPMHLASYLHEVAPDAVALSCSLATGLPRARRMIEAAHDAGVRVLAGGPGFGADGALALRLGADAWAPTARAAAAVLARIPPVRRELPVLDHPGLDEHAELAVRRAELVDEAHRRLADRFPPLRSFDARQTARTREDLGHIVDFLGAASFADEPAIFRRFTSWLQEVLVARGVAETALGLSYEALAESLADTPRSRKLLQDAARALPARRTSGR